MRRGNDNELSSTRCKFSEVVPVGVPGVLYELSGTVYCNDGQDSHNRALDGMIEREHQCREGTSGRSDSASAPERIWVGSDYAAETTNRQGVPR
jgi:hypothetical protein